MMGFFCIKLSLKRDVLAYDFDAEGESEIILNPFHKSNEIVIEKAKFIGKFKSFPASLKKRKLPLKNFDAPMFSHTKATYIDFVKETVDAVKTGEYKKIVTSRYTSITNSVDAIKLYDALCLEYPRTNVYFLSHEKFGVWMGASPETLVKVNDGKFKTMALAGSKLEYQEWNDKEKEEQKIVADYIANILEGYNFDRIKVKGVQTISAGPIQHLRTHYEAAIGENNPMDIALNLHPTPAVCGIPKDEVKKYILAHEGFDRELYSGFIGVKDSGNFDSFVNLRCMRLYKDRIQLFAGGGIMAESTPEIEWNETQTKLQTLMKVMKDVREE